VGENGLIEPVDFFLEELEALIGQAVVEEDACSSESAFQFQPPFEERGGAGEGGGGHGSTRPSAWAAIKTAERGAARQTGRKGARLRLMRPL
jgi:hypothetical protein